MLKISVFGLGCVGTVTAGCLADSGHSIVGVDIDQSKVALFASGHASFLEPEIEGLLTRSQSSGRLSATQDVDAAVGSTDVSLICVNVGTEPDGTQDTKSLETVVRSVGRAIAKKGQFHSIVVRSTVLPGTNRDLIMPILEQEVGKAVGIGFGLAHHPEFMREGSGVSDFRNAARTVIGELDERTADLLVDLTLEFSEAVFRTTPELSEAIKYADNAWHTIKVTFANEIATLCNAMKLDSNALMEIFLADKNLNISNAYLRPGYGFGGSCLSKDLKAIVHWGEQNGLDLHLLSSVEPSNQAHIQRSVDWIISMGGNRFAVLGLAYKTGTNDVRNSPFVQIAWALRATGKEVKALDANVSTARQQPQRVSGTAAETDDLGSFLTTDLPGLIEWADTVIVCARDQRWSDILLQAGGDKVVLDFARFIPAGANRPNVHTFI